MLTNIAKTSSHCFPDVNRNRLIYAILIVLTIGSGLASRHYSEAFPPWVQLYLGDVLWAFMVFLFFGVIFHRKSTWFVSTASLAFSYSIELSQLYHAPWLDALRSNPLGGLILGFGFLWSDLICYVIGITFGYVMENIRFKSGTASQQRQRLNHSAK